MVLPRKCAHCGKWHWWRRKLRHLFKPRLTGFPDTVVTPTGGFVATNYHESGGNIYCHGCWGPFLRSIGE